MTHELEQLKACTDPNDLRAALRALCSRFGLIDRLDILMASQGGKRQALCFLRLDSEAHEQQLMTVLGVGRFGGELVVVVDLHEQESFSPAAISASLRAGRAHEPLHPPH